MKYYKFNSIPLKEMAPTPGSFLYDEFGNGVLFNLLSEPENTVASVLDDGEKMTQYQNPKRALEGFWAASAKEILKKKNGKQI